METHVVIKVEAFNGKESLQFRGTESECKDFQKKWQDHYDKLEDELNENSRHIHQAPSFHVVPDDEVVAALF